MPKNKRRQRGTGSLKLRGRIWWVVYSAGGRPIYESSDSTDKQKAENLLKQRIGELATGKDITPEKATIADLCDLVIADYRLRKLRDLKTVQWRYEANVKPALGSLLASRFSAAQVRAYVAARRAAGAGDATINRELAIVRRGFTLVHQEDPLIGRVPYIAKLEEDNVRQGFIEQGQYVALRAAMPDHLKCLFVVA
jgi:hypothetical protein